MGSWLVRLVLGGVIGLALAGCQAAAPAPWQWERVEAGLPRQAVVTAVAIDPADPDRLWAGYYGPGGLALSGNGGQSWSSGAAGLADNPVFDLLVTSGPLVGERQVWAGTRDGVFYSLDGGASWQPGGPELPAATAFALAADGAGRLYAGLDGAGIYVRPAPGEPWRPLPGIAASTRGGQDQDVADQAAVLALAVSADGRQLYAGTSGQGILASSDAGQTWTATYTGRYVPDVALNPADPAQAVASLRERLVQTRDGGRSWQSLNLPWTRDEIVSLMWLADGRLGAGTGRGRLYLSLDGGDTWLEGGAGLPPSGGVLDLAAAAQPGPDGARRLLAGTWNGLYASDDGGESWFPLAPDLGPPYAYTLLAGENDLLLGSRAGLFRWQPEGRRWRTIPAGLPSGVQSLAAAPANSQILYAGTTADGLYRSDDGGASWRRVPSLKVGIPAVAVDPADPEHVYILAAWERAYESKDGGQTWRARWDGMAVTTEAASIAVDPVEPLTVYVGADAGLYRSHGGEPWHRAARTLADQTVLAILAEHQAGPAGTGSVLYLGTTQGVYRSLNGGRTVQQGSSPAGGEAALAGISVTAFLSDPRRPGYLYAGTAYNGLYRSTDWGETWQPIGPADLANDSVAALAWGPDGELFVVAPGGVWAGVER